ncbi:MAG: S8 family peptidase, partial [Saprospiraceae bacterium]|nr:S8 family peptidase [Saprospiraceae bacterium]
LFGQFWSNRQRLDSPSDGGAAVFDSDGYQSNPETLIPFPHRAGLISPPIDIAGRERVAIQFYQYYRNFESATSVGISVNGGLDWQDIPVNQGIPRTAETSNSNLVFLELTDFLEEQTEIQIRFLFEGSNFFWIIDDVQLLELPPEFGETFPSFLGDSLTQWEVPYLVDTLGGAYPPDELAVQWSPTATEAFKDSLREKLQVVSYDTCTCSDLELFHFADTFEIDLSQNLLVNGDFANGAQDFRSELNNDCGNCNASSYCVGTQMTDICPLNATWTSNNFSAFDDPGVNQFLIVDGSVTPGTDIWCQDVMLEANEDYLFAFRGRNLVGSNPSPQLQLLANGSAVSLNIIEMDASNDWELYFVQWTAASTATVTLCLEQINGGLIGNDYGIDDLILVKDGNTILNIQEKKATADQETDGVQETDFNYYNGDFLDIKNTPAFYGDTYPVPPQPEPAQQEEVVIAILDTGIDYNYKQDITNVGPIAISEYLRPSSQACYPTDILGWNFIHADDPTLQNKPFDDHSHGTHVAGIIIQNWQALTDDCCDLKILPVKTHDFRGLGKLFNVSCGIYYATEEKANFINASWGFSAVQSPTDGVLHNAIAYARDQGDIHLITSAGNEGVSLVDYPDYPSNYDLSNVLSTAALDSMENLWSFSNYSDFWVEYAAKGVGVYSSVPAGSINGDPAIFWTAKSGTSMAAPVVTAAAAKLNCLDYEDNSIDVKGKLEIVSEQSTPLIPSVVDGRTMDVHDLIGRIDDCTLQVTAVINLDDQAKVDVYPNPFQRGLTIRVKDSSVQFHRLLLTDALGRILSQQVLPNQASAWTKELNLSHLPNGVYQLQLLAAEGQVTKMIVKQ